MKAILLRATLAAALAAALALPATPMSAQPAAAPSPQTGAADRPVAAAAAPAMAASVGPAGEITPALADAVRTPPKSMPTNLHELSPWSMFLSADVLVKAVMIGLAFASLVTWTIFFAKAIELGMIRRKLRRALGTIAGARSLAEAQLALASKDSVLAALLAAAMREARLSEGISSDAGIKERAASSFAEIARAEARRVRLGMGVLATIGATSPFVGLFGTVWGLSLIHI